MKNFLFFSVNAIALTTTAAASEFEAQAKAIVESQLTEIASNPAVVSGIQSQNAEHESLSQADLDALDQKWRSGDSALINAVLSNAVSDYLSSVKADGQGLFTELIVMDNRGLNVGLSDRTSDYWQGDEAKWQETYLKGADAIHISDVEEDESSQTFQIQVSIPVVYEGSNIGALTAGVDLEVLE